jgi:hypothetical protein
MASEGARKVDVALAEFDALRGEILVRRGAQKNLVAIALTSYGVLFTFSFARDGDERLLLLVPPLGLALCLLQLGESFHIHRIGRYIKAKLWPTLTGLTGYEHSWEREHSKRLAVGPWIGGVLTDGMFPLLLAGGAVAAIVPYDQIGGFEDDLQWLKIVEWALAIAILAAAPVFAAYVGWSDPHGEPAEGTTAAEDGSDSDMDAEVALDSAATSSRRRIGRPEGGPPHS